MDEPAVSQTTLDFIAEHTSDLILRANEAGEIIYISPSIRAFGYEPEELLGRFRLDLIHPDDQAGFVENSRALMRGEIPPIEKRQHRIRTASGEWVWLEGNPALVFDQGGGRPRELVNVFRDVTRRRRFEEEARAQALLFEAVFEQAAVGKLLVGPDGIVLRANREACRFLGYDEPALRALKLRDILHAEHAPAHQRLLKRLYAGEIERFERDARYVRSDGAIVWGRMSASLLGGAENAQSYLLLNVLDLTERRAAEVALAESETRQASILAHASDMFVLSDLDGMITFVSPAVRRTGFTEEDFVGLNYEAMMPRRHAPDMAAARARLLEGATTQSVRWRGRRGAGGAPLWLESRVTLLRDPKTNSPMAFLDVVRDVDEQVAQEEALAAARAEAESAAAAKALFLSNMSHEISTPLTAVLGFAELLAKRSEMDERARAYIERISAAGNALSALVNDILDFSKLEAGKFEIRPQATDVRALGQEVVDLFSNQAAAKGLVLVYDADTGLPPALRLDGARLRQVLMNLLSNAVKFTDQGQVKLRLAAHGSSAVRLEVVDTGPGLAPDQQAELFQRFNQIDGSLTRRHGGTGLGLAICKGVVEAMGGEIGVASAPGRGAAFHAIIPAAAEEAVGPSPAEDEGPDISGLRLLVVDDHEANRELARRMLETRGAHVVEASGGVEALASLATPFDAVLMDLRMPGMDGREVLRRLRAMPGPNSRAPVLAFTADIDAILENAADFDGIVRKPLSAPAMAAAIAQAVAG